MEDSAATLSENSPKDDNSIDDAATKEKKDDNSAVDDAESLPKAKEDPILDYVIHYAINNALPVRRTYEGEEKGYLKKGCLLNH